MLSFSCTSCSVPVGYRPIEPHLLSFFSFCTSSNRNYVAHLSFVGRCKGALRSQGARGNVYNALEMHHGLFSKSAGEQVTYIGDDLVVKAYFESNRETMSFQAAFNEWELHKTLILLDGVEIDPPDPVPVHRPCDLSRFYL